MAEIIHRVPRLQQQFKHRYIECILPEREYPSGEQIDSEHVVKTNLRQYAEYYWPREFACDFAQLAEKEVQST